MSVWRNSRRIHKFVYEGMSRWQRTQFLWRNSYHVTEAIAQLCWEGGQKDDSWPVFGQFWHEWVDLFLEVLLTLLTSWVDLFLEVLTESHAKKLEPEVKQLFSCVRSESNCRFFKYSIPPIISSCERIPELAEVNGFFSEDEVMTYADNFWCRKTGKQENS